MYRLHRLDRAGKVVAASSFEAGDDVAAIAAARRHRDGEAIELWQGPRLVVRLSGSRSG